MSHIFDALQRSEVETSGPDVTDLLEATELLKRAELRATAQWEAEVRGEKRAIEPLAPTEVRTATRGQVDDIQLELPGRGKFEAPVEATRPFPTFQTFALTAAAKDKLVSLSDGNSMAAEAFRLLSVRLRHLGREKTLRKLLITSSIPREGKSMVAANLAATLTTRQKTLLIEGDVRRPALTQLFSFEKHRGLCDLLRGECTIESAIYQLEGPGFWLLPAGNAVGNPLELLQSAKVPSLLEQLTCWFEWIVIDSPPVIPLADTSIWSRLVDGILFVTRQGTTEKKQLMRGLGTLESRKVLGAILNGSKASEEHGYYYTRPIETPSDENPG
jgi:capsular exopolysaccharide synthesis family protein